MRKSYILIIMLMVGIAFSACKRNQNSDNLSNMESENVKDIIDNQEIDDEGYNSNEANPNGDIDESIDAGIDKYELNIDTDNDLTDDTVIESKTGVHYYIIGDVVRLREDGSLESNTLGLLSTGTRVEYLDREGEWIKVKYDSVIGYIRNDLISETEPIEDTTEEVISVIDNITDASDNFIEAIDNPKVIVKKADRILQLWDGDTLRASYQVGLGWNPAGDKEREGDGKTPEGTYYVCTRNNFSRFYLSLGLSYPNIEDADEGLEAGLIDQSTYNQIEDAISREVQPPWNTSLGGEIMIHGHGSHSDWTAGCIAVDDNIMDILWEHCRMGTKVIIEP